MSSVRALGLSSLSKLIILVAIALLLAGALLHGLTFNAINRFWHDLAERPDGPMRFRFVLQPTMAVIAAIRDGRRDARSGRSPYFVTVLRNPEERVGLLSEGVNATSRIIAIGLVMDVIYQATVFKTFYPDEALFIAIQLGFLPYLIIRGLIARALRDRASARPPEQV